jgi:hypothetical protein
MHVQTTIVALGIHATVRIRSISAIIFSSGSGQATNESFQANRRRVSSLFKAEAMYTEATAYMQKNASRLNNATCAFVTSK